MAALALSSRLRCWPRRFVSSLYFLFSYFDPWYATYTLLVFDYISFFLSPTSLSRTSVALTLSSHFSLSIGYGSSQLEVVVQLHHFISLRDVQIYIYMDRRVPSRENLQFIRARQ